MTYREKVYVNSLCVRLMDNFDLLKQEFLIHGVKNGLAPELLEEVLHFLQTNRNYAAGDREHIRRDLLKLLKDSLGSKS
jgi:hypothetical protein